MNARRWILVAVAILAQTGVSIADPIDEARSWIEASVAEVCPQPVTSGFDVQLALPGVWLLEEQAFPQSQNPRRLVMRFGLPNGGELTLDRRQAGEVLRQFRASVSMPTPTGLAPTVQAIADGTCLVRSGRAIRREGPTEVFLDQLDADLVTVRWTETLQTAWPKGVDPGGERVALVDTGLAYDLDIFRDRLARGPDGAPLGYDFWDLDPWPYDGDTGRGPFLPIRHGTAVASILVEEAPTAALIPYRFPRPDMTRMGDLVDRAARHGARILAMPLGSNRTTDWTTFLDALDRHELLAVVSAGNDGRNIDIEPVYPAAFDHPRIITVTSSDGFGRLAAGSNWGPQSIDIMLPAENLRVTDFRGASGVASGSSYAVPRLAAIAARILDRNPELTAAELKARLIGMAAPSPFEKDRVVAAGWIPDPLVE